jgi:peptidoglycan/xylan/chitin deacetylase (PgdA/CDA1 family)
VILSRTTFLAAIVAAIFVGLMLGGAKGQASRPPAPRPSGPPRPYVRLSPAHDFKKNNAVVHVLTRRRRVAMTFDDGPDPRWTPRFLDLLRRYDARATFFDIGRHVQSYPDLVRREAGEKHEVANHTYNHSPLTMLPIEEIRHQVDAGADAIAATGVPRPTLFRPPRGYFDKRVGQAVADANETMVDWDRPMDPMIRRNGAHRAAQVVLRHITQGGIILAHDGSLHPHRTFTATRLILRGLAKRGYEVVTVSELLGIDSGRRAPAWLINSPAQLTGIEPPLDDILLLP